MSESPAGPELRERLARWTAEGLIEAVQAARIEAAETSRTGPPAGLEGQVPSPPDRRLPLVAEALGYVGAVIAIVAAFIAVHQFWPGIPAGVELAFAGITAGALLVAGAALRTGGEPAFGRLRSVLWLMSTASLAGFMSVLTFRIWQLSGSNGLLPVEAAWTMYATGLWWRSRATLQHLATFAGAAALLATGINRLAPGLTWWGLGIWVLSALWGIAVHRGYLEPRTAGFAAAGTGLLVGAIVAMRTAPGQALAVVTVAGLLAAGVALRRVLLLGFGAVGAFWIVPQTARRYLPGSVVAPLAVAVVGLGLLAIAIWLAKTKKEIPA